MVTTRVPCLILATTILLAACAPSASAINKAIEETQALTNALSTALAGTLQAQVTATPTTYPLPFPTDEPSIALLLLDPDDWNRHYHAGELADLTGPYAGRTTREAIPQWPGDPIQGYRLWILVNDEELGYTEINYFQDADIARQAYAAILGDKSVSWPQYFDLSLGDSVTFARGFMTDSVFPPQSSQPRSASSGAAHSFSSISTMAPYSFPAWMSEATSRIGSKQLRSITRTGSTRE